MANVKNIRKKKLKLPLKLHVGCGKKYMEGYVNIDQSSKVKADIVASVDNLPFADNSVDEIYTAHTLEHVPDFTKAMRELHRVLKQGGKLEIVVPYPACYNAFIPQHLWYFGWDSFRPFKKGNADDYYYDFHFSGIKQKLVFESFNGLISGIANRHPWFYEHSFLKALFPAFELHVDMIK